LIFPEGTNLTQDTIKKSNKFANDQNLPLYKYVLHPRVTGFMHLFNQMSKNNLISNINDVTVAYKASKIPENELDFLKGHIPEEIHFFIDSFSSDDFKINGLVEKNLLEKWLNERWLEKELFLQKYFNF